MSDTMEWFLFDVVGTISVVFTAIVLLWVLSKEIPRKIDEIVTRRILDAEGTAGYLTAITIFLIILGLYLIDVYFLQ